MKLKNQQAGIGLIEALIAALVFAIGIAALVQLQGVFYKNSSSANSRSVAMSIAQEKLEDLRGFQLPISDDNDIFDFAAIGSNTGGRCTEQTDDNTCTTELSSTGTNKSIGVGNIGFSRNWTVTDYYYNSAGALTTTPPAGATVPDQKKIVINVAWTDTDGSNQTLALEGLINRNSGASVGNVVNYSAGGSGEHPEVPYTPSTDTHVVPVGVGTDTKRETLVPSSTTVDGYSRTKFIAYTYAAGGDLLRQEEFQNVACECRFDGSSTDADQTYAAAHPTWDTGEDTYIDVEGELVSGKAKGCVQGGGSNCASTPDPLCDSCCRDHHDSSSATRKYDPFRSSNDFTDAGDHKHYLGSTAVTSGKYLESCRFKRINGTWRVYQDWNLVKFTALPLSDLIDSTRKETYTAYIQAVIDQHLEESKVSGEVLSSPPSKPTALDHTVSNQYVSMTVGNKRELTGRAVYLDYIDSTHLTQIQNKKAANEDYLLHLPFYELEVAPQTYWLSANPSSVRAAPYDGPGTSEDLIGGELKALASNTSATSVTGAIKKSNSGIVALSDAVDFNATTNPDTLTLSDSVKVCIGCSTTPSTDCTLPWGGTISTGISATAYQSATVPYGDSCVSETRTCTSGTLSGTYTHEACSVLPSGDCTTPWGTTVTNGGSALAYESATVISPSTCQSETRSCTDGTLSGTFTHAACTETVNTCTTTVTGKANHNSDTITLSVDGSTSSCTVKSNKAYSCPAATTPLSAVITVTSSGSVSSTVTISSICGSKIVDF